MGINIRIGSETRDFIDERWIAQQIERRRREGTVCVDITVQTTGVDLRFTTPACHGGGGGGFREFTTRERDLIDLWRKHRLDTNTFSAGDVIAFLKQLRRVGIAA